MTQLAGRILAAFVAERIPNGATIQAGSTITITADANADLRDRGQYTYHHGCLQKTGAPLTG